jgi:glycosidase
MVDSANVVWWITLNGLTAGQEYAFQYLVDGNLRIADPYTAKGLDPWNDSTITSSTYPNLKPYPYGKTAEPASVLMTNQPSYGWHTTNYRRPAKTDLVTYELLVRDFVSTHDFKTLTDTLRYFKTLGVNAIELMPVMEFEGNESWGYNPSFHLAVDKYYGPANDLKVFVDSAHANGVAVILDVVLNHAFGQSPLVRLYWDAANNRPASNSPWFNPVATHPYSVGYDFNHESQATKDYVDRVMKYWLTEFHVDGFRFDMSKGFTQTFSGSDVALWGQYDQSRINILQRMANKIWAIDSTAYVILEHFADNSEETVLAGDGMMLWGNMNYNYNEATMGYNDISKSDLSWGSYRTRGWTYPHLITYMESHDEERLMYRNLQYGNSYGYYSTRNPLTALNRIKLAAAFLFTIPGPKMIWQFGELGYDISIEYGGRLSNKPIRWDYYNDPARSVLFKVFAALMKLKAYDAFRSNSIVADVAGPAKRIAITHPSMDVRIIGNFDVVPLGVDPTFSRTGIWYDYFSGDSVDIADTHALRYIQPGESHIYTTMKLPVPDLSSNSNGGLTPSVFVLHQNYPNPFNPGTTIRFELPKTSHVTLTVYDILGREVSVLLDESRNAGVHELQFDASGLASGIYFYRLQAEGFVQTRKLVHVK